MKYLMILSLLSLGFQLKASPSCQKDSDCVLVQAGCCSCGNGGDSRAIHKSQEKNYKRNMKARCGRSHRCLAWYRCDDFKAKCINSKCSVKKVKF